MLSLNNIIQSYIIHNSPNFAKIWIHIYIYMPRKQAGRRKNVLADTPLVRLWFYSSWSPGSLTGLRAGRATLPNSTPSAQLNSTRKMPGLLKINGTYLLALQKNKDLTSSLCFPKCLTLGPSSLFCRFQASPSGSCRKGRL